MNEFDKLWKNSGLEEYRLRRTACEHVWEHQQKRIVCLEKELNDRIDSIEDYYKTVAAQAITIDNLRRELDQYKQAVREVERTLATILRRDDA